MHAKLIEFNIITKRTTKMYILTGDGNPVKMKTMYKVVQSPEDLKDFLKDTIKEIKKLKSDNKLDNTKVTEDEEDEEEVEDGEKKMKIPKIPVQGKPPTYKEYV